MSAPDEGDATAAAAEIDAWVAEQQDRDWMSVLGTMRDRLTLLAINPVIRSDPEARRIFNSFADCEDIEGIDRVCSELQARVAVILALRRPAPAPRMAESGSPRPVTILQPPGRIRI